MEATIFVLSSLATNLAGIYWHVPFTVVDPQHTFLERLLGSVQVSSTIYTLRILQWNLVTYTIHHTLFGRTFDIPLDQNTADLYWTVFFTALVLIAIILVLLKGFTQGRRKHDTDATSGQKSDVSADLPSEKEGLNWIRIARFAVALGIKDDISQDGVKIRAKITEIPENLRQFQRILQSHFMGAECKEGDDVESNKKTLAQVFDGHLRFCTEAVKSALEALNQLSRRVDHRINLHEQPLDGFGHGQGDQKLEDSIEEFRLYQHEFLTKGTLEATTSAMEKRILGTVDDHISALGAEAKKRIDSIESALAKVQQSLSIGIVDKEQLDEIIGGVKADIENLHTSLQSPSPEGNDSQVGVDTTVHEQLQSLEKRVQSLERAASVTPLDKKQIEQELDELDEAVFNLKNSHAVMQSKLDSTVTITQVEEALKEIAAHLEQRTEVMENQVRGLMKALDEVKNAAVEAKNNDPELAKRLEDIERAIDDSTKEVQSFRKELDSHALEHTSLQEAVNRALEWNKELEDGIKQKITRVTRNIMEVNDRIHIPFQTMHKLEEYKSQQRNINMSIWGHLDKCMHALGIKFDLSAADLVTLHTRNQDPVGKPESNDEDLAAEHGAHKTGTEVVDEGPSGKEARATGFQINQQVQKFDEQRRASAQSELISPRTSKPDSPPISGPKQSPVASGGDEAAKHDRADTAQSRAEHSQHGGKAHESAALGTRFKETSAQPKASEGTQSPQTSGSARGKSSGKHNPKGLRLKPETSTSARYEKSQGPGPASAQSPSKSSTESASAEMGKSMWAPSTPTQAQPKTSEGTQSPQTPGSAKGKSSGKHTPRTAQLKPEPSTSSAKCEKSKGAGAASTQSPSNPKTESTSAEMSKSRWAASASTQAQPETPTHAGVEGSQPASPASAQDPSKLGASAAAEMNKSMWAKSTPAQARPKTPTRAEVEVSQASAKAPPKLAAHASAEMNKSRWADSSQLATPAPAQSPSKLAAPASAGLSKSRWADSSQLATPAPAQSPSKLAAPASAGLSKSRWADEPPTAQRSKSVSLPSERNKKGDLGDTF